MKIHLRQIPDEGLRFDGEEDCPITEVAGQEVRCAGPLRYALDVGISGDALWASGTIAQPVEMQCVSCLEHFTHDIEVKNFALHTEIAGPETVDLTPFFREDILLNLPAYPHCDREGGRVCKAPVAAAVTQDEPEARKPDWSALDKLEL